jgi:diguanylate cyclase (GGDEF)-like protein
MDTMTALIADDDRGTLAILHTTLTRLGLDVVSASDGAAAWELLRSRQGLSLAIVDWMMPGIDGIELCRRVRSEPTLAAMYLIVLTARDGKADLIAGLRAGADDYVVKPFDLEELHARVQVGVRIVSLQERLADQIVELQQARDALDRLASSDALTGLYSRRRWYEVGAQELLRFKRYQRPFSVLFADLDFFKRINDTFGHAGGDEVLKRFADVLRREVRDCDAMGRIGGEEFAVLLPESGIDSARDVASRIVERCRAVAVPVESTSIAFSCSIGVAEATRADQTIEAVVERADRAMYEAKRQGRGRVMVASAVARSD